jgi:hypothetical protein
MIMCFFWILVIIGFVLLTYSWTRKDYDYNGLVGMIGVILLLVAIAIADAHINAHIKDHNPTALDVYRGNTELEITSVNGIPTDTVVVFKNK